MRWIVAAIASYPLTKPLVYEGLGLLFSVSLQNEDYFMLLADTLLGAVLAVLGNLLADITLMIADPQVRLT